MLVCGSTDAWVESIKRVWEDSSLRHDLGCAARQWVEREHDWEQAAEQLIAFTRDALPSRTALRQAA